MTRRLPNVLLIAALLVASGALVSVVWRSGGPDIFAKPPEPIRPAVEASAPDPDDLPNTFGASQPIISPRPGDPPGYTRIAPPSVEPGPRRIGIQIGHWQTDNVPPELRRLEIQTGTSWGEYTEVGVAQDIAVRVGDLLKVYGYIVDYLPTTVPQGYVADAFISLHMDGDGTGENSGFKMAHGSRRGPYEQQLLDDVRAEYGAITGLDYDQAHVSRNMLAYFAFSWQRYRSATSPFTPSVILEMGYLSNDGDRDLAVNHGEILALGIATGIERFLAEVPSSELFSKDLLLPPTRPAFPSPSPSATP